MDAKVCRTGDASISIHCQRLLLSGIEGAIWRTWNAGWKWVENSCRIRSIGNGAFKNNKKIKKVIIGKNVTAIGKKAFYGNKKLKKVIVKSTKLKKIGKKAFFRKAGKKIVFKVPKKKIKKYKKLLKTAGTKKYIVKK